MREQYNGHVEFMGLMEKVWIYVTLVTRYIIRPSIIFVLIISFMFLMLVKTFSLFIILQKTIMLSLNIGLIFSLLRIRTWVLLQGRCVGGLYPMPSPSVSAQKQVLGVQSSSHWHRRLGHPSSVVVQKILRGNDISFSESNKESV
jgi:hypothetical protein